MTINNKDRFFDGVWDWGCLNGCFGETKIAPTDIDGLAERNGRFLVLETKQSGVKIPEGQEIVFKQMIATGLHTIVIIWGKKNIPEEIEVRIREDKRFHYPNADMNRLRKIVSDWFEWAQKQTPASEF